MKAVMPPRKGMRGRYLLALAMTACVAIAQFVVLSDEIYGSRRQAQIVFLASQQRTLAVEIASLASAYIDASSDERPDVRAHLAASTIELGDTERELVDPNFAKNPRGWPPSTVRELFGGPPFEVTERTRDFVTHAQRLLDAPPKLLLRRNDDLVYLTNVGSDLAFRYRAVVTAYIEAGNVQQRTLIEHEAIALAALLLTLALELPLIFGPMETEIERLIGSFVNAAGKVVTAERTAHLGTWEVDLRSGRLEWSEGLRQIYGLEPGDVTSYPEEFDHPADPAPLRLALATNRAAKRAYSIDHRILTRAGEERWIQEQVQIRYDAAGKSIGILGTAFDISELKFAEDELYYQANHDSLTGLPNRRLLRDRLVATLAQAKTSGATVAIMYADLDRFKVVNDSLGHASGDLLLQSTAARLLACVREGDTVARNGGDEFVLVISNTNERDARATASRIVAACEITHAIDGLELDAPLSIGIALYPRDGDDVDALMRAADIAMYRAKEAGGARACDYERRDAERRYDRLGLERQLRAAIANGELVMHYQPIVDRARRAIVVEALVRWQHPDHGLLGPDRFIHIAEASGTIHALGEWVLQRATNDVGRLQREGFAELRVAVNVSSRQFRETDYVDGVACILEESGFAPASLDLEITESVVMHDVEAAIVTMRELKGRSIRISIDDFGTGYSSLAYLQRFPIDTLKIDRRFIKDLPESASDAAIVESIMTLARNLGLRVVAEGIETEAQFAMLARMRCDEFQGFAFARPMPIEELRAWLGSALPERSAAQA